MYTIKCKECGELFESPYASSAYCSKECMKLYTSKNGKYTIECKQCGKIFKSNASNAAYCSHDCREEYAQSLRKPEIEKTCICGKVFTTTHSGRKYCSKECQCIATRENAKIQTRDRHKAHEIGTSYSDFEIQNKDLISDVLRQFRREKDFQDFVNQFYYLFGFRNILKCDPYFPDIIAIDKRDVIHRIEIEYHANNFIAHGHDPKGCDFIYSIFSHTDIIKNIPVRYFFKTKGISIDNIIDFGNIMLPLHYGVLS